MGLIPCPEPVTEGWLIRGYRHSCIGTRPQVGEEESIRGFARITREMALLQPRLLLLGGCMPRGITGESMPENEATNEESPSETYPDTLEYLDPAIPEGGMIPDFPFI